MDKNVKILLVEDLASDALLAQREITKALKNVVFELVETEKDFVFQLENFKPDIVVSDFQMPSFDGLSALKIVLEMFPIIPVIILTGSQNEDTAVDCMKMGATDYVIKEHIKRLGPAVLNALEKKKIKIQNINNQLLLVESEERFRRLAENAQDIIFRLELYPEKVISYISPAVNSITAYKPEDFYANLNFINKLIHPEDLDFYTQSLHNESLIKTPLTMRWFTKEGKEIWIEQRSVPIYEDGKIIAIEGIARDITSLKKAEENLRLFKRAVDHSSATVFITDFKGNIEYVNQAFLKISGYSFEEVRGKNPRILKSGCHNKQFYIDLWNTILSGNTWEGEIRNKRKTGELYWEHAIISPIFNQNRVISHFVAVKEDITDKKKIFEELVSEKEKAQLSDKLKTAFLHNMSHEIRTPMNGILGFLELLKHPEVSEVQKNKYIDFVNKSGKRLLTTINDIIEISKIESGQLELYLSIVNINEMMQFNLDFFKPQAEEKGISLIYNQKLDEEQSTIMSDKFKLEGVLSNLINNAIKFTAKGGVIEIGSYFKDDNIVFYVKDSGIGIEKSKQKMVFSTFVQADQNLTRPYEGSGLGLAIVKAYIEKMNGKIQLESEVGKGTNFCFTIPYIAKNENKNIDK